jgi:2-polyprenyl-6-methoxyphenol hydroxylase-like FAD-dependent oxidoreductase
MAETSSKRNPGAVVIGGSMAGLWAARVLADHFHRVTVVERDDLPDGPDHRPGVPQDYQVHVLLLRGLQVMNRLFPGLEEELMALGAPRIDLTGESLIRARGIWTEPYPSGKLMLCSSRIQLEAALRGRLRSDPRISFMDGTRVTGLVGVDGPAGAAVAGVRVRPRGGAAAAAAQDETLPATFVVDASGRNSRTPQWLAELGYPAPETSTVNSFLGYACRRYQPPAGWDAPWRMLLIFAHAPHDPRGGLILPEEDGDWMVMLAGAVRDYPPTDEAGFLEFARSLGPEFAGAIREATPLTQIRGYQRTENVRRHYEKLARWPRSFVVVGDAVAAFNPIYGQGMTVSAVTALTLDEVLRQADGDPGGAATRFQKAVTGAVDPAWLLATGADYAWPETKGSGRNLVTRFSHWYTGKLLDTATVDHTVNDVFIDVNQLIKPPAALFGPGIAWRILRHHLRR